MLQSEKNEKGKRSPNSPGEEEQGANKTLRKME